MENIVLVSGDEVTGEQIREYFQLVLKAELSGEEYPIDFDLVWPLAYSRKDAAKRALVSEFYEGEDYIITLHNNVERNNRLPAGMVLPEQIYLTPKCLEFFVARKVRPVFEIYRQCRIEVVNAMKAGMRMPYHLRRYSANQSRIPMGYFSILSELSMRLIAPLEFHGYTIPDNMLPDGSEGKLFCNWLRNVKGLDPSSFPSYDHHYEDGRIVQARLYPLSLLSDFVTHFQDEWLNNRAQKYFQKRDPKALEHLPKMITPSIEEDKKALE